MVVAKILKPIYDAGSIIGFELKMQDGKKVQVKVEAVKKNMLSGALKLTNACLDDDNNIVVKLGDKGERGESQPSAPRSSKTSSRNPSSGTEIRKDEAAESAESAAKAEEMHKAMTSDAGDSARIKQLVELLNKAREVYEQGQDEIMTNLEYDRLYDELLALEEKTGITLSNSPTQNVGFEVTSSHAKVKHEFPMLSLDKTKSVDDLVGMLSGRDGVLSWKLDGLTVVMTYENGELHQAVTRGNGEIGEDITENAKRIVALPHKIPFKGKLVVRGEALMSYPDFEVARERAEKIDGVEYKNPRNLCSGTIRAKNSALMSERKIYFKAFELVYAEGYDQPNFYDERLAWLKSLGFTCVEYVVVSPSLTAKNSLITAISVMSQMVGKDGFPKDGLVLTFRDRVYGESLGRTAKFYRHSMAFKWQDEIKETTLLNIEWQVGRTGIITPVAIFAPIELEGSTVQRASLHNISIMTELLGRPYLGQKIGVYKANMIIPTVAWGEKLEKADNSD